MARKRWGAKTAWAKSFFSVEPASVSDASASPPLEDSSMSTTGATRSCRHSSGGDGVTPSLPLQREERTLTLSERAQRKRQRVLEQDAGTRWRCNRCGECLLLPQDPHTGRPCFTLLAEHLEGRRAAMHGVSTESASNEKQERVKERDDVSHVAHSTSAIPPCVAGTLLFDAQEDTSVLATSRCRSQQQEGEARVAGNVAGTAGAASGGSTEKKEETVMAKKRLMEVLLQTGTREGETGSNNNSNNKDNDDDDNEKTSNSTRVFIVVENPKTPANLGSILRAMGCYGVTDGALIFSGTRLLQALRHSPATDTRSIGRVVSQVQVPSLQVLFDAVAELRGGSRCGAKDSTPSLAASFVAVDLIEGATLLPLYVHPFSNGTMQGASNNINNSDGSEEVDATTSSGARPLCPRPMVFYLFGAEDGTLSKEYLEQCDAAVYMPTTSSMNLAASINVLLYDRVMKECVAAATNASAETTTTTSSVVAASQVEVWGRACVLARNANNHLKWESK